MRWKVAVPNPQHDTSGTGKEVEDRWLDAIGAIEGGPKADQNSSIEGFGDGADAHHSDDQGNKVRSQSGLLCEPPRATGLLTGSEALLLLPKPRSSGPIRA